MSAPASPVDVALALLRDAGVDARTPDRAPRARPGAGALAPGDRARVAAALARFGVNLVAGADRGLRGSGARDRTPWRFLALALPPGLESADIGPGPWGGAVQQFLALSPGLSALARVAGRALPPDDMFAVFVSEMADGRDGLRALWRMAQREYRRARETAAWDATGMARALAREPREYLRPGDRALARLERAAEAVFAWRRRGGDVAPLRDHALSVLPDRPRASKRRRARWIAIDGARLPVAGLSVLGELARDALIHINRHPA